ncbi:hypothetical protein [Phyllobacterium chamaecytisi]|uniref:hypothetical protein n=1 Tax=Phyllobacterium chamaecytisi TaxID=2876082 RepID=UPI001CCD12FD|nr:hypothetical protein [Phyllobacterium sp. KW56]MBZ9605440.1 hypothetical protein [Phyllobacterium sp. KW56]
MHIVAFLSWRAAENICSETATISTCALAPARGEGQKLRRSHPSIKEPLAIDGRLVMPVGPDAMSQRFGKTDRSSMSPIFRRVALAQAKTKRIAINARNN